MTPGWLVAQTDFSPGIGVPLRGFFGILVVLGIVSVLAWLARRGSLRLPGSLRRNPIVVETAAPLGDRRSLVIVSIEGRRLLLGLTPMHVSLVTELGSVPSPSFVEALDRHAPAERGLA